MFRLALIRTIAFSVLLAGCVSFPKEHYGYPSPLKKTYGCPDISGTYVSSVMGSRWSDYQTADSFGSLMAARLLIENDKSASNALDSYLKRREKDETIEVRISGDTNNQIAVSIFSSENSLPIAETSLSKSRDEYSCSDGYVIFNKRENKSFDHECCSGTRTRQAFFSNAEDGALVAREDHSFFGVVLIIPSYERYRNWFVVKKKSN